MFLRVRVSNRRISSFVSLSRRRRRRLAGFGGLAAAGAALVSAGATLAWPPAPNGRLAFDRGDTIVTANADGSHVLTLAPGGCCATWAPSGTQLAVTDVTSDGRFTYALVDPDGSNRTSPVEFDVPGLNVGYEAWSPDGSLIAGEAWDDTDPTKNGVYLHRAGDGSGLTRILETPGRRNQVGDFSPDGTRLVFVQYAGLAGDDKRAIFIVNLDGSGLRQVTPWGMAGCCTASWSPDGRLIVFDDHGRLFVVRPDGSGLRQLPVHARGRYFAFEPDWSPDGTRIAFSMYVSRLGQDDIYTIRPDGSNLDQVTNTQEHEGQVDWGTSPEIPLR